MELLQHGRLRVLAVRRRHVDGHEHYDQHRHGRVGHVQPGQKEQVWKGQASKTIDEKANPEKRQKNLDKAMTKLLKDFPPKPKSQT